MTRDARSDLWLRGCVEIQKDIKLWICLLLLLVALRAALIAAFWSELDPSAGAHDVALAMGNGLRFDLRSSLVLLAPCWLASLASPWLGNARLAGFRRGWGTLVLTVTALLGLVDAAFVAEYHEQFNHWIFGLVFDDLGAIAGTVWDEYPVVWAGLATLAFAWICRRMLGVWLAMPFVTAGRLSDTKSAFRIVATCALLLLLAAASRGSLGSRPIQLRDAAVTRDAFLNELVPDPYSALRYAVKAQLELNGSTGSHVFLPDGDPAAAAARLFPDSARSDDLLDYLTRRSRGVLRERPRHIVLVVAEGYDTWPMLPRYESLGLTPELRDLAARGIAIDGFVSAGASTTSALVTLIGGVPHAGVHANYRASSREPYPTSLPVALEALGYTTRFFYGGYLSWQRIGDFARDQGFDEVYGGNHMASWGAGNEWGVDDDVLFRFARERIDPDRPSFDLIMTTSYHSPFDIDVRERGFPLDAMPHDLADLHDGRFPIEVFGHLWFADRSLGEFIHAMERALPRPLFVVTGDHGSRRFLNRRPSYYEHRAVPCVFYGPEVLGGLAPPARTAGSHLDLVTTLIELAAPEGHAYHAFGRDMLDAGEPLGFGRQSAIGPDFIVDVREGALHAFPGSERAPPGIDVTELVRRHDDLAGLGWWLVVRGRALSVAGPTPVN